MNAVVVVESPAKAKTINKYLGGDYEVLASFGHIRDLPSKDGSVRPDEDFAMDWEVDAKSDKRLKELAAAVKKADALYLATDPDREGEAISWHVLEELRRRRALKDQQIHRVTFNAITKASVLDAMAKPRDLDQPLIDAYLARRALDYLMGFSLSPVLWRKLPGSRSAGRVQSVALRLICDREAEIEAFRPQEYWSVDVDLATDGGDAFSARLTHLNGEKLDKHSIKDKAAADAAVAALAAAPYKVVSVERKARQRRPFAPYTTSTLQQDAANRLHFGAKRTMGVAQKLYEGITLGGETVGLITYMRTDGVQMAPEAVGAVRDHIKGAFPANYLPEKPRYYATKAKNAQEAHEAIRPTDPARTPEKMKPYLSDEQFKLYDLIWKRTVASQMENAVLDQVAVDIATADGKATVRANGSVVKFDGFLKLYQVFRDTDEEGEDGDGKRLPAMDEGQSLTLTDTRAEQHFTQPPRYSEASLVKTLEEKGIGRPSTYASIIDVLQAREYVKLDKRRFVPEDRGRIVTAFLESYFDRYVQYGFTADLETRLDEISDGKLDWRSVLSDFWRDLLANIERTQDLKRSEVVEEIQTLLAPYLFPPREDGSDPQACPKCSGGRLGLKTGKFGAFIGCSNYPECKFTRQLASSAAEVAEAEAAAEGPVELGTDPATGFAVTLRRGPYGPYIQLGEPVTEGKKKTKPKRASLPKGMSPEEMTLEKALKLLALPREVGTHPDSGEMILAGIGRFGPYLKLGDRYVSLPADDDVLEVGLNRAVTIIAEAPNKGRRATKPAKELGAHPADQKPVTLHDGRYGPYVQHLKLRASLPKGTEAEGYTLEQAVELLNAKAEKSGKPAPKAKAAKKAPAKKTAAKKTTAKKKAAPKAKKAAEEPAES